MPACPRRRASSLVFLGRWLRESSLTEDDAESGVADGHQDGRDAGRDSRPDAGVCQRRARLIDSAGRAGADIYELGLIYKIDVDDARNIAIDMTLTSPGCPVAGEMPAWVENAVSAVAGVGQVSVKVTFDPPWDKDRMSDEAKLALGMF
jgi:FeS assembly SUF system protein